MPLPFPNVPNVPGVPPLPRPPGALTGAIVLLAADLVAGAIAALLGPRWGIFLDGEPVVFAESVAAFEYKQDWTIADYPIERGGFESYDKVQLPFDVRLRFSQGGSESERQAFLNSVDAAANTLDLYDVLTPEVVYQGLNISHYDYRRTSHNGVGLIVVDVWLTQVRVTATSTFSNTKNPANAGNQNGGAVQSRLDPGISIAPGPTSAGFQ
jgi:hypothetical protein